jgi:hypothetical protein
MRKFATVIITIYKDGYKQDMKNYIGPSPSTISITSLVGKFFRDMCPMKNLIFLRRTTYRSASAALFQGAPLDGWTAKSWTKIVARASMLFSLTGRRPLTGSTTSGCSLAVVLRHKEHAVEMVQEISHRTKPVCPVWRRQSTGQRAGPFALYLIRGRPARPSEDKPRPVRR